jgi:cobalt-zinc-cadmium efflux system membrane fusion protein
LTGGLRFAASVAFNPDQVAHVSPLVEGQLVQVSARVGQEVESGDELATLRSVELGAARAELSRANAMLEVASQTSERQQRLRSEGINSERSLLDAQLTEEQARAERDAARSWLRALDAPAFGGAEMALRSPIAGEIVERHATRGESVSTADTLFVIVDLDEVWVIGNALQDQVQALSVGMPAQLSLMAYPGRIWEGQVDYIGAIVDPETRTLPVRVVLANPDRMLRPGLAGEMTLQATTPGTASTRATVPADAVQDMEGRSIVFVPGAEPSTFDVRPVTTGANDGHSVAVIAGLDVGEEVVVAGAFVLLSELMRDELGHGHAH